MSRRDTDLPKARQVPAIRPPVQGLRTSQGLERRAHGREGRVGERLKIAMVRPLPPSLPPRGAGGARPPPPGGGRGGGEGGGGGGGGGGGRGHYKKHKKK